MNIINSFITCPACRRMHELRTWLCEACGFEHAPIVNAAAAESSTAGLPTTPAAPAVNPELTATEVLARVKAAI